MMNENEVWVIEIYTGRILTHTDRTLRPPYLVADGREVRIEHFPELFLSLQRRFPLGYGDEGAETFRLPQRNEWTNPAVLREVHDNLEGVGQDAVYSAIHGRN